MRDFKTMDSKALAKEMREIELTTLTTRAADGNLASGPMSRNGWVECDGDSYAFTVTQSRIVTDIEADARVGLLFEGRHRVRGVAMIEVSAPRIHDRVGENEAEVPVWLGSHQGGE